MRRFEQVDAMYVIPIPHMVVIQVASHIRNLRDRIRTRESVGHVVAARVRGQLYAVDNLDVFFAYRKAGEPRIPCHVRDFSSVGEALLEHMRKSAMLPINPIRYGEAEKVVRRALGAMPLAPGVKERMGNYIDGLGERLMHIPSFFHVFEAVSGLDKGAQLGVVDEIIELCRRTGRDDRPLAVPDPNSVKNLIRRYKRRNAAQPDEPAAEYGGGVLVEVNDTEPGWYHEPDTANIQFRCYCGKEFLIGNAKENTSVRERDVREDMTILSGEHGAPAYPIRRDAADYLNLDCKPTIHYYMPFGRKHGSVVIMSKRRLTKEVQEKIHRLIATSGKESEAPELGVPGPVGRPLSSGSQLHGGEVKADEVQSAGCAIRYSGQPTKGHHPLPVVSNTDTADGELPIS